MWPHLDDEYRAELQGIADGVDAQGGKSAGGGSSLDVWDIVALNASLEWPYYTDELKKAADGKIATVNAEHCSAFVATGSYTKDGKVVIAHNNWTNYLDGERWNIIFDIRARARLPHSSWTACPA